MGNFLESQITVTLDAFKDGILVASNEKTIGGHQKWVGISTSIWEGIGYDDVDMVLIQSDQPITAPVSITGNNDQTRHVFFSGQILDQN